MISSRTHQNIDRTSIGLEESRGIFINEKLAPINNNKIAFHCRELKRKGRIDKAYSRDSLVYIVSKDIENAKKIKIVHMNTLHDRFPDFDFGEDGQATKFV